MNEITKLVSEEIVKLLPVNYQTLEQTNPMDLYISAVKSTFHETNYYPIIPFYKPISKINIK